MLPHAREISAESTLESRSRMAAGSYPPKAGVGGTALKGRGAAATLGVQPASITVNVAAAMLRAGCPCAARAWDGIASSAGKRCGAPGLRVLARTVSHNADAAAFRPARDAS